MRTVKADVAVVGAGPSGSAAATYLARYGAAVVVLDRARFPREKVCGDGLTPRAVTVLADLRVEDRLRSLGYKPHGSYRLVSSRGESVVAGFPDYGKGGRYGYVVPRIVLDQLLMEEAGDAGAQIMEETEALCLEREGSGTSAVLLRARTTGGEEIRIEAQVIIAADGSRGSFSRAVLGADRMQPYAIAIRGYAEGVRDLEDHLHFFLDPALLPGGYGWIFPSGRPGEPANIGVGLTVAQLKRRAQRPSQLLKMFLSTHSLARRHLQHVRLVTRPSACPVLMGVCRGRRMAQGVLFVGDAAHLVDPLSGQGIANALESGRSAAAVVTLALHTGQCGHLLRYPLHVLVASFPELMSARVLRGMLARPWCNELVVRVLSRDEALARAGVAVLANSIPVYGVLHPMLLGKVIAPHRLAAIVRADRPAVGPPA